MGMPISTYTVLQALGDKSASPREYAKRAAHAALAPFKLFAFIIHDPERHQPLNTVIDQRFDRLDFLTGRRFLFFALADPPRHWLEHARHRPYFKHFDSFETNRMLDPENSILSADPSATAFSIAYQLKIPVDRLPCIVVTPSFEEPRFIWFRTCPEHIEKQLTELGFLAERGRTLLKDIRAAGLDLCDGSGDESIEGNLARALAQVLSFVVSRNSEDRWLRDMASEQASAELSKLQKRLQQIKAGATELADEEFDDLNIKIATFLQLMLRRPSCERLIQIDEGLIERDSYQILKTADRVADALSQSNAGGLDFDMTPALICLAKVFEKEANLSVVHWARRQLGVNLPPYYNKHQPHVKAKHTPTGSSFPIDLNKKRSGKWHPPGMGQSNLVCADLSQTRLPSGWDKATLDVLIRNWTTIFQKRNEAAHTEIIQVAAFEAVRDALKNLSLGAVFDRFYEMKSRYSGRPV